MRCICRSPRRRLVMVAGLLCHGCVSGPAFTGSIERLSNAQIDVVRVSARVKSGGIAVGGDVRRPNGYAGVVPGHLNIVGRDAAGHVVASADAPWGEFKNRRFRLAYFAATLLTSEPSKVVEIRVEPITSVNP